MKNNNFSTVSEVPDELKFVDDDIREEFYGKNYFIGTPTNIQLAREIKKLRIALLDKNYE